MSDRVPFVDLRSQAAALRSEVEEAWGGCIERCDFILGSETRSFEEEYAAFLGAGHVVGVGSGLEALILALDGLGVSAGDTCVVPANTFVATALAVSRLGAKVAWCDVDPRTRLMTAETLGRALEVCGKPAAVLPVHLCGRAVEPEVFARCDELGVPVVEDAAQSQGARFSDGGTTGTRGAVGCFSFYPGKNLGAFGDAGAICTDDDDLAERLRQKRHYGQKVKYEHVLFGTNTRLDTVQAAVLRIKLRRLTEWNRARAAAAANYDRLLAERVPEATRPELAPEGTHVWHLYRIDCRDTAQRDRLGPALAEQDIEAGIHYPIPCHRQACYQGAWEGKPDLSVTEGEAARTFSLPMFPEITPAQQERVVEALAAAW